MSDLVTALLCRLGNVPVLWCLFLDVGGKISQVRQTIKRILKEYAGNVPVSWFAFRMWVGRFLWHGRQFGEYLENMKEMCQCHGDCFLDVDGKCSWVRDPHAPPPTQPCPPFPIRSRDILLIVPRTYENVPPKSKKQAP
jgi:hypothetical protein